MKNIKNIIFDYGNVIFSIDFQRASQAFKNIGLEHIDDLFGHRAQANFFDDFEKGKITAELFVSEVKKFVPTATNQEIIDAWNALLIGIDEGNLELLLKAKAKYRTFLLSNNNEIHYNWIIEYLKHKWNIADMSAYFEKDYYSHLMGLRKPNADIFEEVLKIHNLNPEETLFIDDSPQHIATAAKLGLNTRLVAPGEPLKEVLAEYL
ncbi:HAD family phosphatase [Solitalea longa]|uniref:HAD family phosphatase n=1 Tax=Solitalea longa TaxID=2079460 RepID=A0A2S4ZWE3_9SPHI|nr:HAD family phosphatase [Solitalea longa]POY34690.1 HAD family phosphatase [Solitalea longa]